ncbi:sensor histidine kinase [Streptomyces sp. P9(2023)]|uniref:sensor histidine kinase n=1 Tax=Streptomyces sp. P9(2023) TaxID=3064394 RepID=UPI0028F4514A|nr:sensor histidine kinase [Streptomyces sp. P9(2023)]MDT9690151.1 sensor histidine kinase [Streptomyces sp. P9(2023)]
MRLRTLLIWLAVVPTLAMGTQVVVIVGQLLERSQHLRADVAAGERYGAPLFTLMAEMQAERRMTAARWAGASVTENDLRDTRAATDRAAAQFRSLMPAGPEGAERADRHLQEVTSGLDDLAAYRDRADARSSSAHGAIAYYNRVIDQIVGVYQDAFSHGAEGELAQESRPMVAMLSASEMVAREDTILALVEPSRELSPTAFAEFANAVGAHRYLYETWVVPYLPAEERVSYAQLTGSDAWRTKTAIENAVVSEHKDLDSGGVRLLPRDVADWRAAHKEFAAGLAALNAERSRAVAARADAKAAELEAEVTWLIAGSGGALLLVVLVVVFTTRSVLRRLRGLHERTVTVADKTLPDVVDRLQRGQSVAADALPTVGGDKDEVGRISDAFARVVAVSVDGHQQLAAERQGFGMFAAGIASRTGNLVSRQLSLTEDLQDAFGHNEALLAQLMKSDQLTVGMRRQIENLLILADGEISDPHTEPMRVADLLREAAAEVEEFRRIERQALDEISVEPRVISQVSHLLAELLDNATRFSPPRSKVVIRAEAVADGLSVEIEDRGPRVSPERYEEMNARLHSAPPYSVLAENAHRLGLFVVGHLADQLGATVTLRRSVFGGTSAVVILPKDLLVRTESRTEPVRESSGEPVQPSVPAPPAVPAPRPPEERKPELVLHAGSGLPTRRVADRAPERPADAATPDGTPDGTSRPALPERVPQTHIAEQLRAPRAPEETVVQDKATPEEVADAWADFQHGIQTVEEELRRDQP